MLGIFRFYLPFRWRWNLFYVNEIYWPSTRHIYSFYFILFYIYLFLFFVKYISFLSLQAMEVDIVLHVAPFARLVRLSFQFCLVSIFLCKFVVRFAFVLSFNCRRNETANEHVSDSHLYFTKTKLNFHIILTSKQTNTLFFLHYKVTHTRTDEKFQLSFVWIVRRFFLMGLCSFPFHFLSSVYIASFAFFSTQCSLQPDATDSDYFNSLFVWKLSGVSISKFIHWIVLLIPTHSILTCELFGWNFQFDQRFVRYRFWNVSIFGVFSVSVYFGFFSFFSFTYFIHWNYFYDRPLNVIANARCRLLKRKIPFRLECQSIQIVRWT